MPDPFPRAYFGEVSETLPDWRKAPAEEVEEEGKIDDSVIAMLGFNPQDLLPE